ncbi:FAD binding domain-containing protein [bacterium]|nr:FAD binding domain-containing protein [bacterium]
MILPNFKYHQPTSIEDALRIAQDADGDYDFVAGGTDVLPNYKNRLNNRANVISLSGIKELREISPTSIGAMATLTQLEESTELKKQLPVIPQTAHLIATPLLRNAATVGGNILLDTRCWFFNQTYLWRESKGFCLKADGDVCLVVPQKEICYATYSGDLAPVFMVLDASFHLAGPDGKREVTASRFFTHDGITRNVKYPDEILTHISIPRQSLKLKAAYDKLRIRDSMDYPVMGAAVVLSLNGKTIETLRIAVTGTDTTPLIYPEITDQYIGDQITKELIGRVSDEVMEEVKPYRNVHFSPQYRKAMVGVYLRRLLSELTRSASA